MILHTNNKGKTKPITFKTTKSTELPILYKFREALLIRHNIIADNWDFKEIFNVDGNQIKNIDELEKYTRKIISFFTNEDPSAIDFSKCKLKKQEYLADCKKITHGLTKNHKYEPVRTWKRQERVDFLAEQFKNKTKHKLSSTGYQNLYTLIDTFYTNPKDDKLAQSTQYDNGILETLVAGKMNHAGENDKVNMEKVKKEKQTKI